MQDNCAETTRSGSQSSCDSLFMEKPQERINNQFRLELGNIFGPSDSKAFPVVKVSDTRDNAIKTFDDKSFGTFADNNDLKVKETDDKKLEFSIDYNGERVVIGKVEKNQKGLENIRRSLSEYRDVKKWELEQKYGIKIASPKDAPPHQRQQNPHESPGKKLEVREPNLSELSGLESALEKGALSGTKGSDMKPVTFYFLKDESYAPGMGGTASYDTNVNGGPAVIVDPNSLDKTPVTENDRADGSKNAHASIESIFIHELGHHSEEKVFKTPAQRVEFYKRLGWTPIPGSSREHPDWMIEGKNGGFAPPADGSPNGPWEKIGKDGQNLGQISRDKVVKLAKVMPSTSYFEGPHEVLAEGLTMFRLGDRHRDQLKKNSVLYSLIKEFDQREINMTFGKGKFIRSYSGKLVPKTPKNEADLIRREEQNLRH